MLFLEKRFEKLNYNPVKVVAGQVIRHFASLGVGFLTAYGVTHSQQQDLIEWVVSFALAVGGVLTIQVWAYAKKKAAFETPPIELLEELAEAERKVEELKEKTRKPKTGDIANA